MAKYDAVDHLMSLANEKVAPKRTATANETSDAASHVTSGEAAAAGQAEAVLEQKVSAPEPGVPAYPAPPQTLAEPFTDTRSTARASTRIVDQPSQAIAMAQPRLSPGDRGRQIFGVLRPFLPIVGSALRMVDHGAVQAVARLLPLLSGGAAANESSAAQAAQHQQSETANAALLSMNSQQAALTEELATCKLRMDAQEEQMRRTRESLERTVAEQGSLSLQLHRLADRTRLLTTGIILLFVLIVAETILMVFLTRR